MYTYSSADKVRDFGGTGDAVFIELSQHEIELFIEALRARAEKCKRAIRDIRNNPNNEGQATYLAKIDAQRNVISSCEEKIEQLKSVSDSYISKN